jgi:hypothetical protein
MAVVIPLAVLGNSVISGFWYANSLNLLKTCLIVSYFSDLSTLNPVYLNPRQFISWHRWLSLFCNLVNYFAHTLLPAILFITALFIVAICFYLIRVEVGFTLAMLLLTLLFLSLFNFALIAFGGAEVAAKLALFQETGAVLCDVRGAHNRYLKTVYKSCGEIRVYVGNFLAFSRFAPLVMSYKIVDMLVTLLCTVPN